jgi:translation initiation factor IF-3
LAKQEGKQLVIISAKTNPPVAKIMDYGKFKYNRKKRLKGEKVKQTIINNREVRLTPLIGIHDLNTKARKAREFILRGDRVKVSLKFKGRELARKDLGFETLKKFFALIEDIAKVDKEPKLNAHRFLDMYVTQDKKKINTLKGETNAKNEIKKSTEQEN